jgi:hypothetical protein
MEFVLIGLLMLVLSSPLGWFVLIVLALCIANAVVNYEK